MNINGITSTFSADYSTAKTGAARGFSREERPTTNQILSNLTSALGLTDNQQIEIKKILQNATSEDPFAGLGAGSDFASLKKAADQKRDQTDEAIKKVLTEDQKAIFEKMKTDMKARGPEGKPPTNAKPDASKIVSTLTNKLGLNDNQQIELKSIDETEDESAKKTIFDAMNESVKGILNEEQTSIFENFLAEMKNGRA